MRTRWADFLFGGVVLGRVWHIWDRYAYETLTAVMQRDTRGCFFVDGSLLSRERWSPSPLILARVLAGGVLVSLASYTAYPASY